MKFLCGYVSVSCNFSLASEGSSNCILRNFLHSFRRSTLRSDYIDNRGELQQTVAHFFVLPISDLLACTSEERQETHDQLLRITSLFLPLFLFIRIW